MLAPLLIVGLLLAIAPVAAGDQVYKWIDAGGNLTYSSAPPAGASAEAVEIPPSPSAAEIEAARQREQALKALGDQLSLERRDREAELAAEQRAARVEAASRQPALPAQDIGPPSAVGWWIPAHPRRGPGVRLPHHPPMWPVPPARPAGRNPTAPPDHPVYWPREPVMLPGERPRPRPRPLPLPSAR